MLGVRKELPPRAHSLLLVVHQKLLGFEVLCKLLVEVHGLFELNFGVAVSLALRVVKFLEFLDLFHNFFVLFRVVSFLTLLPIV